MISSKVPNSAAHIQSAPPTSSAGLSIIVPVYNEQKTVTQVINALVTLSLPLPLEIILVDDGSTDGTREILRNISRQHGLQVIFHARNAGKGAAIQTGLHVAHGQYVLVQDADLELMPSDIPRLMQAILNDGHVVCFGSRFLENNSRFLHLPSYWANRILTLVCNVLNHIHLSDMNTGYKLMPTKLARELGVESRGFTMEPEITTKIARRGIRIREVPVEYHPRTREEGKKIRPIDFIRYLLAMIRFRFRD